MKTLTERLTRGAWEGLFPRWRAPSDRPKARAHDDALRITWLGTAGHVVQTKTTTILLDPYLSRPRFRDLARERLVSDERAIRAWIPKHVDAVLCGHSHFDHLLDAPKIAILTGAKLCGSRSTCNVGRGAGVPEAQLLEVPPEGRTFTIGDVEARFVPSLHGRIALGRVPFPVEIRTASSSPMRMWHYRMGGAFGILLRTRAGSGSGPTVYHNGSADLIDAEVVGEHADVLLIGLAGRKGTRDYVHRLIAALNPSVIVPTHHDLFFSPLEEGLRMIPGIDLDGFVMEARGEAPHASIMLPNYGEPLQIPNVDPRGATFVD
ncbi:MBL fold metallo-hydrolase [soil metagenome]